MSYRHNEFDTLNFADAGLFTLADDRASEVDSSRGDFDGSATGDPDAFAAFRDAFTRDWAVAGSLTSPASVSAAAKPATVEVAAGGAATIAGPGTDAVSFAGSTGTLAIEDAPAFHGDVSGMSGSDTIDLADIAFNADTRATFLGTASGGTLTVTDGSETAKIALTGDYLSSTWSLSSDGKGGTNIVDPTVSENWQVLKVGAGGYADGLDEAPDGTVVVRTNTNGAYLWNGSSWQQLVTSTSMPAAFVAANPVSSGQGVYEIQIAPSNSNIMYMMFDGYVFVSTNKGTNWTQTSFAQVTEDPNDDFDAFGQKMAIDPNNPDIAYVGTPQKGLWVTKNGGTTWTQVTAVPVSGTSGGQYPGISGIMFDPAIGGVVNGVTQTIFASSYGNGVYQSTNGGSTWTQLTGGPTDVEYATVGANGAYYAVGEGNENLWRYYDGAWTELLAGDNSGYGIAAVAINPDNPNEIAVVANCGLINVSYNGGATWSGLDWSFSIKSSDIPWEAAAQQGANGSGLYLTVGGAAFSETTPNELILSTGTGSFDVNIPTSSLTGTLTYNDNSAGIENLVANEVLVAPGGTPILASWDRPFIQITNLGAYPSTYGPVDSDNIVAGWSVDYASSTPSFLVGIADWWGTEESGYSTNGGKTWTPFATELSGGGSSFIGGTIAASTTTNFIWAPADGNQPYYTLDGGKTWNPITLPGVTSWSNFDFAYYLEDRTVTADRVLANTFYLYYPGTGVFETTNGGVSWTEVHTGALSPGDGYNSEIMSVPGEAGNLFWTAGMQGNGTNPPSSAQFMMSTNQGKTWTAVANVLDVTCFGFGAAAPGSSYPSIYIVGYVNKVFGVWQSTNQGQSWVQIGTQPAGELVQIDTISGDPDVYGRVYVGFEGGGYAYLSGSTPVTVADYLANQSTLDAAGDIAISDTAANVASAIGTLNADKNVTAITLTDTANLTLTAAQALDDTRALGVITNSGFGVTITDTGANISANFNALNDDSLITAITPTGGSQTLTLTVTQMLDDTHALSLLDPFTIKVTGAAASLDALTAAQIKDFAADGVTTITSTSGDLTLTAAQDAALGAGGISVIEPYAAGTTEVVTFNASGGLATILYQGITGQAYTSYTVTYGANGKRASASYSNGMSAKWTYNANGSCAVAFSGVTGQAYTSYTVDYGANGKRTSVAFSDGMTETWKYDADGSYSLVATRIPHAAYFASEAIFNTAGVDVAISDNMYVGSGNLALRGDDLTLSSGAGGGLSLASGSDSFWLESHTTETVNATGYSSETFAFASGFGSESITGFATGSDKLSLKLAMFKGLSASDTAAQDAAILLSSGAMVQSGSNVKITDLGGDVLTLVGVTTAQLTQNASSVFKFS
jgi:hypothetical protein